MSVSIGNASNRDVVDRNYQLYSVNPSTILILSRKFSGKGIFMLIQFQKKKKKRFDKDKVLKVHILIPPADYVYRSHMTQFRRGYCNLKYR